MQLMFRGKPILKYAVTAALSVLLFAAVQVKAAPSPTMLQVELIQWLVALSGDTGSLPPSPAPTDYVQWAVDAGLEPAGGWQPTEVLTRDALGQVLVQYFGYKIKPGSDPYRALKREGIELGKETYITRGNWASVMDALGPGSWAPPGHVKHSPWDPPNPPKHQTPPGKNKGWNGQNKPPGHQKHDP